MRLRVLPLALGLMALAFTGVARAEGPSPYRHDLIRASAKLALAIEVRPAELGEALLISEAVCALALRAGGREDEPAADSDWSTLSQLLEASDRPGAQAVDRAFASADAMFGGLRRYFSAGWRARPQKVRTLNRAVRRVRQGIDEMGRAMDRLEGAFAAWSAHDCTAALAAIEGGARALPSGVGEVNLGMRRLWALAEGPSSEAKH